MNLKQIQEFELIIEQFQDQLIKYAFFRVGSYEDAQDIVQNTFIRFFDKSIDTRKFENTKSFLYRTIYNACIDYIRVNKRVKSVSIETYPEIESVDNSNYNKLIEEYKRINTILSYLPAEQAEIVQLRVIDELSFVEISKILKIPASTAKSRFKYGVEKLKSKYLKRKEISYEL